MTDGKRRIYLAGPITQRTYGEATGWRDYVRQRFAGTGIEVVSPMRGKEYLRSLERIGGRPDEAYMRNVFSSQKGILGRDRNDVRTSDAILMNLMDAGERISIGTMIEAGWADSYRIPIVLAIEPGNIHEHVMLDGLATYVVKTLEEAIYGVSLLLNVAPTLPYSRTPAVTSANDAPLIPISLKVGI